MLSLLGPAGPGLRLVVLLLALGALAVVAVATARQVSLRGRSAAQAGLRGEQPAAADLFAEADRLAGREDFAGAVRALALAVARHLVETRGADLTASPLTVREIYRSSPDAERLRPLLLAFEESFYGHHGLTAVRYRAVESVAATYRSSAERAA